MIILYLIITTRGPPSMSCIDSHPTLPAGCNRGKFERLDKGICGRLKMFCVILVVMIAAWVGRVDPTYHPFGMFFFQCRNFCKVIGIYLIKTWVEASGTKCLVEGFWSWQIAIWKRSDLPMSQNKGLSKTLYKWLEETNGYGGPEKVRHIFSGDTWDTSFRPINCLSSRSRWYIVKTR